MKRLKQDAENRIKNLFKKICEPEQVAILNGSYVITIGYEDEYNNTFMTFSKESKTLKNLENDFFDHKTIMEIIKIIHNNLCNEENWEEI